ncbi:MAG: aminoglycoside phosphotransferase family protein [Anaerolineales bacterium]|nr:aminoglycoside phosphotransferase family protein [Anaerolineales bacterium]
MLEKPDLDDRFLVSGLESAYGLRVAEVVFLPLGADVNTAVYRATSADGTAYFLKLIKGAFDEISVAVPRFLRAQGIQAIIAPFETADRLLWGRLGAYKMILYPFVQGRNGYEAPLSEEHWVTLGAALRGVHTAVAPPALASRIGRDCYSARWREAVRAFSIQVERDSFDDPVAAQLAAFVHSRRDEVGQMVGRAEHLGAMLQSRSLPFVLCHADMHPGNLLIADDGAVFIVDWDNPVFAPKERDLMAIGAGMGGAEPDSRAEGWFYQGYGQTEVDLMALAYYRYERIIQDLAAFCEQVLSCSEGGQDREMAVRYLTGQFLPGREVETAFRTDTVSVR